MNGDWSCMTFDKHARQAKRSLYGVMVTGPGARGRGWGGLGRGCMDCMSSVNRKNTVLLRNSAADVNLLFVSVSNLYWILLQSSMRPIIRKFQTQRVFSNTCTIVLTSLSSSNHLNLANYSVINKCKKGKYFTTISYVCIESSIKYQMERDPLSFFETKLTKNTYIIDVWLHGKDI